MSTASSFWRLAKISYVEYLAKSTTALRTCLKEPLKTQAAGREKVGYTRAFWEGGARGERSDIESLAQAAAKV